MVEFKLDVKITGNGARVVPVIKFTNDKPNERSRAWFLSLLMFANSCGLLAGCSIGESNTDVDTPTPPTFSKDDPYYEELMQSYWQESVLSFLEKLDKVTIKYDHENDYPDASDIKSQMKSAETTAECAYKYGGDFNEIWNLLLRNSVDYTIVTQTLYYHL